MKTLRMNNVTGMMPTFDSQREAVNNLCTPYCSPVIRNAGRLQETRNMLAANVLTQESVSRGEVNNIARG